jgi:hypothetical protein
MLEIEIKLYLCMNIVSIDACTSIQQLMYNYFHCSIPNWFCLGFHCLNSKKGETVSPCSLRSKYNIQT